MVSSLATSSAPARFEAAFDWLHATAVEQTNLDDFGDSRYHTGLRVLLDAMDRDSTFSENGRHLTLTHLIGVLKARLHTENGWKRNPGYRAVDIRPLVITAMPRSGTSALHRLLAVDPQFQGLQRWLAAAPMVRPPISEWSRIPAFRASQADTENFNKESPEFASAHEEAAHAVEECMEVLQQGFVSNMFASRFPTPNTPCVRLVCRAHLVQVKTSVRKDSQVVTVGAATGVIGCAPTEAPTCSGALAMSALTDATGAAAGESGATDVSVTVAIAAAVEAAACRDTHTSTPIACKY